MWCRNLSWNYSNRKSLFCKDGPDPVFYKEHKSHWWLRYEHYILIGRSGPRTCLPGHHVEHPSLHNHGRLRAQAPCCPQKTGSDGPIFLFKIFCYFCETVVHALNWHSVQRKNIYVLIDNLKGIYPEFQVIRGFSQKIPAGLLSYDQIHS